MEIFKPHHGLLKDLSSDAFSSELLYFYHNDLLLESNEITPSTYFGFVTEGKLTLRYADNDYKLQPKVEPILCV